MNARAVLDKVKEYGLTVRLEGSSPKLSNLGKIRPDKKSALPFLLELLKKFRDEIIVELGGRVVPSTFHVESAPAPPEALYDGTTFRVKLKGEVYAEYLYAEPFTIDYQLSELTLEHTRPGTVVLEVLTADRGWVVVPYDDWRVWVRVHREERYREEGRPVGECADKPERGIVHAGQPVPAPKPCKLTYRRRSPDASGGLFE